MQQNEIPKVSVEDLVGRQALIHLHEPAFRDLNIQGFDSPRFRAVILGVDTLGLWIEHPAYKLTMVYDDEGNYIPPQSRKEIAYRAAILIIWGAVKTIVFFPDQEIVLPTDEVPVIGFSHVRERERELDEKREQAELSKKMEDVVKGQPKGKEKKG
jgi:hypothetical protein